GSSYIRADQSGRIVMVSPSAVSLFGYDSIQEKPQKNEFRYTRGKYARLPAEGRLVTRSVAAETNNERPCTDVSAGLALPGALCSMQRIWADSRPSRPDGSHHWMDTCHLPVAKTPCSDKSTVPSRGDRYEDFAQADLVPGWRRRAFRGTG